MKKVFIASTVASLAFASSALASGTNAADNGGKVPVSNSAKTEISSAGKEKAICDR